MVLSLRHLHSFYHLSEQFSSRDTPTCRRKLGGPQLHADRLRPCQERSYWLPRAFGYRAPHGYESGAHLKVAAKGILEPLAAVTQNASVHRPLQRLGLDDTVRALCRPE